MAVSTFGEIVRAAAPRERYVKCNTVVTEAFAHGGGCWARDPRLGSTGLYLPLRDVSDSPLSSSYLDYDYEMHEKLRALEQAEQYRMAVTDEGLPADIEEGAHLLVNRDPFFCRAFMILWLGRIRYGPASPDIEEAMMHDTSPAIRGYAAVALGRIGDRKYTNGIIGVMGNDRSEMVRHDVLEALGEMKDEAALPALREIWEEGRRQVYVAHFTGDNIMNTKGQNKMIDAIRVMKRIGGRLTDETIMEASRDCNFWVGWSAGKGIEYSRLEG